MQHEHEQDDEAGPGDAEADGQGPGRAGGTQEVEASAGGGMVTVKVTGDLQIISIKIDPGAVDPDDVEMLEDMVLAATNEALRSAQELAANKMSGLTGGLNIPGLM